MCTNLRTTALKESKAASEETGTHTCSCGEFQTERTHVDPEVFCDSSAVFSQHTEGQALLKEDPHLVFVLELHLEATKTQ